MYFTLRIFLGNFLKISLYLYFFIYRQNIFHVSKRIWSFFIAFLFDFWNVLNVRVSCKSNKFNMNLRFIYSFEIIILNVALSLKFNQFFNKFFILGGFLISSIWILPPPPPFSLFQSFFPNYLSGCTEKQIPQSRCFQCIAIFLNFEWNRGSFPFRRLLYNNDAS